MVPFLGTTGSGTFAFDAPATAGIVPIGSSVFPFPSPPSILAPSLATATLTCLGDNCSPATATTLCSANRVWDASLSCPYPLPPLAQPSRNRPRT